MIKQVRTAALIDDNRRRLNHELGARHEELDLIMQKHDLDAALFVGNSSVGPRAYGNFRYFSNHKVYYHLQAVVARPKKPMMVCCGSVLHKSALEEKQFEDIRISPDIFGSVMSTLSEQSLKRLGVCLDMLPSLWYLEIHRRFPELELVDITEDVFALRSNRTELEASLTRECAKIADIGYKAVCDMVRPGIRLAELHAEMDFAMKSAGAEETFTLMSNGRFSFKNNGLPCISAFSGSNDSVVRHGDNVAMEITPKYMGYWTQIVRTVCVGEPNPELEVLHRLQLQVLEETVPLIKTGGTLQSVLDKIWSFAGQNGYEAKLPYGHIVGLDLDEAGRSSMTCNEVFMRNMTVVMHPTLLTPDIDYGIFWGDAYLVADDGGERISHSSDELLVL